MTKWTFNSHDWSAVSTLGVLWRLQIAWSMSDAIRHERIITTCSVESNSWRHLSFSVIKVILLFIRFKPVDGNAPNSHYHSKRFNHLSEFTYCDQNSISVKTQWKYDISTPFFAVLLGVSCCTCWRNSTYQTCWQTCFGSEKIAVLLSSCEKYKIWVF